MENRVYKVLSIAGFDGSGGAGIQADLKTFSALGCYGTTVLTALPVQNTVGVRSVYDISTFCIEEQIEAVLEDIQIDAIKIGMLHRPAVIQSIAMILKKYPVPTIVLDPVIFAKSGDRLLQPASLSAMREKLFPITAVLTPNLFEASELLGRTISTKSQMEQAAWDLMEWGFQAVIVKGGHLEGPCEDCLCLNTPGPTIHWLSAPRIQTHNTHGTGCTFSAAIAAFLAKGFSILEAVNRAKCYLTQAIKAGASLQIGRGNGPVHHFHHLWSFL